MIDLHYWPTPNGKKVTILLEECGQLVGIDQAGRVRTNSLSILNAIQAMENDAVASSDDFHTQTALLNKITDGLLPAKEKSSPVVPETGKKLPVKQAD